MSDLVWKEDTSTEVTFTDCPTCKGKGTIVLSRDGTTTDTQGLLEQRDALVAALKVTLSTLDAICDMEGFDKHVQNGSQVARALIANTEGGE